MRAKRIVLVFTLSLLLPGAAMASLGYSYAHISQPNSTVTLLNISPGTGILRAVKCVFPSGAYGASVKLTITTDAGTLGEHDFSFIVDPNYFQRESNGSGQLLSDWVSLNLGFNNTVLVQLNNTNLGTATINCWATWTNVLRE